MVITNITLENFKCFRHVSVHPKLITVFIGPNGTGKSGVLQALLLLKQSRNDVDPLALTGELIRFAPEAFMWRGPESGTDCVRLSLCGCSPIDSEEVQGSVQFKVDLQFSGQANLNADRGSTKWITSGQEYEISFDRNRRNPEQQLQEVQSRTRCCLKSTASESTMVREAKILPYLCGGNFLKRLQKRWQT